MTTTRKKTEDIPGTKHHQVYKLKNGRIVPGGSTIAKIAGAHESEKYLLRWANRLGQDGYDHEKYRDKLADVGTLLHAMSLEFFRSGNYSELFDQYPKWVGDQAKVCFKKFEDYAAEREFEPILMEKELVSEIYQYGGTLDWYGRVKFPKVTGTWKHKLGDYKTGKRVYHSHFYQLAGYNTLLFEHGYESEEIDVIRLGRNEREGFELKTKTSKEILLQWEIYRKALEMYWLQRGENKYV